ncbi:PcfB family protein [Listeria seeligeri]|uniref:PcfB family protein n=1 Tax=Listeria seeligeri TaxID=1640 RepID=UPI001888B627|nr:PcfB family protein [Listeria seeligeri]MBF2599138.1 PcfB family protein [Listeria seeligeri]
MQEEINHKTIALSINTTKMSARTLKKALQVFMKGSGVVIRKQKQRSHSGKQTIKKLMKQNTGLANVEITDENIGSFKRVAKKYGIDFALKKDKTAEQPTFLVYFKGRDVDVMTQAFKEYTQKQTRSKEKPSILAKLEEQKQNIAQDNIAHLDKVLGKDKGLER